MSERRRTQVNNSFGPAAHKACNFCSNRTFRTRLVLFWMLCNAIVSVGVGYIAGLHPDEDVVRERQSMYFHFILISTFL